MSQHSSTGRAWMVTKNRVLVEHGYVCYYCKDYATQVDHVVPKSMGGTDDRSNLVACCKFCNQLKKAKPLTDALVKRMQQARAQRMGRTDVAQDVSVNGYGYVNGERSVSWINSNLLDPSLFDGDYQVDNDPTVYNNKTRPFLKTA